MPTIQSNGCPIHVEVEGPENKPVLMLSNSLGTTLHMWDAQVAAVDAALPPGALRPARPRQVRRAGRPLHHGDARPRRAGGARRAEDREDQLVRPLDGRHGRHVARRQCAAARRQARSSPTRRRISPTRRSGTGASRPCREQGPRRDRAAAPWSAGSPRISASASRRRSQWIERHVPRHQAGRLHRQWRGGARHGSPRDHQVDHRADAGHRRPARSRHHGRGRRIHPQPHSAREPDRARRRALANVEQPHDYADAVLGFLLQK